MGEVEPFVDEALVPWFYRTLRHAAIDRFRRREAASRALEAIDVGGKAVKAQSATSPFDSWPTSAAPLLSGLVSSTSSPRGDP